jgi:hypothetical protein
MFIPDYVLGWGVFLVPFVMVGVVVARRRKSSAAIRHGAAYSSLNANGLPMIGCVDVNGNNTGSISAHQTNVNGLPMVGSVDICGNAFGATGHAF